MNFRKNMFMNNNLESHSNIGIIMILNVWQNERTSRARYMFRKLASCFVVCCFIVFAITGCSQTSKESTEIGMHQTKKDFDIAATTKSEDSSTADETTQTKNDSSAKNTDSEILRSYMEFLNSLTIHDPGSIAKALAQYKEIIKTTHDSKTNDQLFRYFLPFFHLVQISIKDTIPSEYDVLDQITEKSTEGRYYTVIGSSKIADKSLKTTAELLSQNGYAVFSSEIGLYISEDPEFLYNQFSDTLSIGVKDYLVLRSNDLKTGAVIDDAALCITWDTLSDRVILWEKYAKTYSGSPEAEEAAAMVKYYMKLYLVDIKLDNTPMFQNGILTDDVKASYERFIKTYPDSEYYPVVASYYSILEKNNFVLTSEAETFLIQNNLKSSKVSSENNIIANSCFYPIQPSDIYTIAVVMTDGTFSEDTDPGPFQGWNYEGKFSIEARDKSGNLVSSLDLNSMFNEKSLIFGKVFDIAFEDYNSDGNLDFSIGQYGSSNGYIYYLFSVTPNYQIINLPIGDGNSLFSSQFDYSAAFDKVDKATFIVSYYDNTIGQNIENYYIWKNDKFNLQKSEKVAE